MEVWKEGSLQRYVINAAGLTGFGRVPLLRPCAERLMPNDPDNPSNEGDTPNEQDDNGTPEEPDTNTDAR